MFKAMEKQCNYLLCNELIKKAMLKRRRLARASISKIQGGSLKKMYVVK